MVAMYNDAAPALMSGTTTTLRSEAGYQAERARLPLKHPNFFLISDARGL